MTLIDRLSKLEGPDREVDAEICILLQYGGKNSEGATNVRTDPDWADDDLLFEIDGEPCCNPIPEMTASVDAAIAMAETVLPGWRVENLCEWENETLRSRGPWTCDLRKNGENFFSPLKGKCSHAPSPAIAICIAILSAKEASHGQ